MELGFGTFLLISVPFADSGVQTHHILRSVRAGAMFGHLGKKQFPSNAERSR